MLQPGQQRRRRQHLDPGRGQLDRQRQPVEAAADLGHGRGVLLGQRRSPGRTARAPLDEEAGPRRRRRSRPAPAGPVRSGSASGGTGNSCSPARRSTARLVTSAVRPGQAASRSATTGARPRAPARSCRGPGAGGRRRSTAQTCSARRLAGVSRTPSAWAIVGRTRPGSATAARATKATPSGKSPAIARRDADRQPRLADAARPGQRQQPHVVAPQQRADRGDLALAADEGVSGNRQAGAVAVPPPDRARRRQAIGAGSGGQGIGHDGTPEDGRQITLCVGAIMGSGRPVVNKRQRQP